MVMFTMIVPHLMRQIPRRTSYENMPTDAWARRRLDADLSAGVARIGGPMTTDPNYTPPTPVVPPRTPGVVTAAFVCSLLGFICGLPALIGLILGIVGLSKSKSAGAGRGLSVAAIVISAAWLVIGGIVTVVLLFAGALAGSSSGTAVPSVAPAQVYEDITAREWALIAKDPDAYVGRGIVVYGVITQFDSATGSASFRADVSARPQEDEYSYDTNTILQGAESTLSSFVEGDQFRAQVTVASATSYSNVMGGETVVPVLQVQNISLLGS